MPIGDLFHTSLTCTLYVNTCTTKLFFYPVPSLSLYIFPLSLSISSFSRSDTHTHTLAHTLNLAGSFFCHLQSLSPQSTFTDSLLLSPHVSSRRRHYRSPITSPPLTVVSQVHAEFEISPPHHGHVCAWCEMMAKHEHCMTVRSIIRVPIFRTRQNVDPETRRVPHGSNRRYRQSGRPTRRPVIRRRRR